MPPLLFGTNYTASVSPGFSPTDVSGLQIWLSDTGDETGTWSDQSGHGWDLTQVTSSKQPTVVPAVLNSHQVRRFDGVDDVMTEATGLQVGSVFIVAKCNVNPFGSYYGLFGGADFNSGPDTYYTAAGGTTHWDVSQGARKYYLNGSLSVEAAPGAWNIYSIVDAAPRSSTSYCFGNDRNWIYGGRYWPGDYAEVIIYDQPLSTSDRQAVEAYLATKYGITLAP